MVNVYRTKLDIKNSKPNFRPIFVQYDHAKLEIELLDDGKAYDLSSADRVEFTHVLKDNSVITQSGEIITIDDKKIICYEYLGSEMDLRGTNRTSFAIFDVNNKKVSSHSFEVSIVRDLRDEIASPASPNYGLLQKLINDVSDLKETGINGRDGYTPIKDIDYFDGVDGRDGADGIDGMTAYDIAVNNGFVGTETEWLMSLKGEDGGGGGEIDVSTILIPITEEGTRTNYVEIPFEWMEGDVNFRDINSGGLNSGTDWKTTSLDDVIHVQGTVYKFDFPSSTPQMRILTYTNNTFAGNLSVFCNEEFTLSNNITSFGFNAATRHSSPSTSLNTFEDLSSINQLRLVKVVGEGEGEIEGGTERLVPLVELLNSFESRLSGNVDNEDDNEEHVLKVLMIGNSFSEDVQEYIHNICHSADVKALFGNLYRPGESLEGHVSQATSNANSYTYHKRSSVGSATHSSVGGISLLTALQDEDWDIITYQQASILSVDYDTFTPHLENLIAYVNQHKTNTNLNHAIHMTWEYSGRDDMYPDIVNSYRQAMFDNDIDIIIPVGTAIENARSIPHLQELDYDLTDDGTHLSDMGDYIGGLTLFESLIAGKFKKNIFQDVNFTVESKYHSYLSKLAVKNAVLNPFNITDI